MRVTSATVLELLKLHELLLHVALAAVLRFRAIGVVGLQARLFDLPWLSLPVDFHAFLLPRGFSRQPGFSLP